MDTDKIFLKTIYNGIAQLLPEDEFKRKLSLNRPLRVKFGMDPTAPDLHLGHVVVLNKLKEFQDAGHQIILVIGDFTARIGDPTGRSKTRPSLSDEEIAHNTKTYFEQVSRILDPTNIDIRYNSQWLSQLTSADIISICAKITVARLLEREDFAKRLQDRLPISMHELLYPIMQAYDSVELRADVELGGTDQTFNLLFGRYLQERFNQEPQVIITCPILEGLDGVEKMSKSLGNAISLTESADQAYSKLMSISDELMWRYFRLLLQKNESELKTMQEGCKTERLHPMTLKKEMAHAIIVRYWSPDLAKEAQNKFELLFQKKDYSHAQEVSLPKNASQSLWIVDLLKEIGAIETSSEAKRLIEAGAIIVDGEKVTSFKQMILCHKDMSIKVGKHKIYKLI